MYYTLLPEPFINDAQSMFFPKSEDQVSRPYKIKGRQWYIIAYKISCLQNRTTFLQ
jgi:hypothetical protein